MPNSVKRGDTWPPIYGLATDETGAMVPLEDADFVVLLAKSGSTLISGTVDAISGGTVLDTGGTANWSYTWAAGDTDTVGEYTAELEIHWDEAASPPKIQTIPNDGGDTLNITQDQGDA